MIELKLYGGYMKKIIITIICVIALLYTSFNINKISSYIANLFGDNQIIQIEKKSIYAKNESYKFVSPTDDYIPYSYNDLLNILYSITNNRYENFTFYCPNEYTECINDMESISHDAYLTHVKNFVHPYNSFTEIHFTIRENKEINVEIHYQYTQEQINEIENEVDKIYKKLYDSNETVYNNIKAIHDYIINTTSYNVDKEKETIDKYVSDTAYEALFTHKTDCAGYTDLMAIFLTKMGVNNYRIAQINNNNNDASKPKNHIWNAVYYDNKWVHLDLTWDDPVSNDGKDYLFHKYFLVSTEEMNKVDSGEVILNVHNFDNSVYIEFNDSIKYATES